MLELKRMREVEVTSAGVREALREGSLALPPLRAFPADEGVGGCASRTEELLNKSSVTQADPFSLAPRQFEELIAEIWDRRLSCGTDRTHKGWRQRHSGSHEIFRGEPSFSD